MISCSDIFFSSDDGRSHADRPELNKAAAVLARSKSRSAFPTGLIRQAGEGWQHNPTGPKYPHGMPSGTGTSGRWLRR